MVKGPRLELSLIEQQVMLALLRLHPIGYGVTVQQQILARSGRELSLGTIYAALERLVEKGFARSRYGESTAERGGKRKLHYEISAAGEKALKESLQALDSLRAGTDYEEAMA